MTINPAVIEALKVLGWWPVLILFGLLSGVLIAFWLLNYQPKFIR